MSALSGLDIALWDLLSRRLHLPLYVILGGAMRHKIKVYSWIGGDRPDDVYVIVEPPRVGSFTVMSSSVTGPILKIPTIQGAPLILLPFLAKQPPANAMLKASVR